MQRKAVRTNKFEFGTVTRSFPKNHDLPRIQQSVSLFLNIFSTYASLPRDDYKHKNFKDGQYIFSQKHLATH